MASSRMGQEQPPRARSSPPPGRERLRQDCMPLGEELIDETVAQEEFIPSFSVYRPVLATEEMHDFHARLDDLFERMPYRIRPLSKMSVSLVQGQDIETVFRNAQVEPMPDEIHDTAEVIKKGLLSLVRDCPRQLNMPSGAIYGFGNAKPMTPGLVSDGWGGFRARYATHDGLGNKLFNMQFVSESNLVIGAITQTLQQIYRDEPPGDGDFQSVDLSLLHSVTPHLAIGTKTRGQQLTGNELAELNGRVAEFLPPEIPLFDPIISLRLDEGKTGSYVDYLGKSVNYKKSLSLRNPENYGRYLLGRIDQESEDI